MNCVRLGDQYFIVRAVRNPLDLLGYEYITAIKSTVKGDIPVNRLERKKTWTNYV